MAKTRELAWKWRKVSISKMFWEVEWLRIDDIVYMKEKERSKITPRLLA